LQFFGEVGDQASGSVAFPEFKVRVPKIAAFAATEFGQVLNHRVIFGPGGEREAGDLVFG